MRPAVWLASSSVVFYWVYRILYDKPIEAEVNTALKIYTLQNTIPFGKLVGSASNDSILVLFGTKKVATVGKVSQIVTEIDIPIAFQVAF